MSLNSLSFTQSINRIDTIVTIEPLFFLDENRISSSDMQKINPNDIAAIEVLKDTSALKIFGKEGKNGAIYITTINHAREKYIEFFKSKSSDYANIVQSIDDEINIVYILNNKILKRENAGDLYLIDDSNFIDLKVLNKVELEKEYNILDKNSGILISTVHKNKE